MEALESTPLLLGWASVSAEARNIDDEFVDKPDALASGHKQPASEVQSDVTLQRTWHQLVSVKNRLARLL